MGARAGTNRAMENAQGGTAPEPEPPAPPSPATGAASATGAATDRIALLQQLAQLHDSGALTDEEFAAEKAKVLA
jgi:hypothetical protein